MSAAMTSQLASEIGELPLPVLLRSLRRLKCHSSDELLQSLPRGVINALPCDCRKLDKPARQTLVKTLVKQLLIQSLSADKELAMSLQDTLVDNNQKSLKHLLTHNLGPFQLSPAIVEPLSFCPDDCAEIAFSAFKLRPSA